MPTYQTEADRNIDAMADRWRTIAQEDIDAIGAWRDATAERLADYWNGACGIPPTPPEAARDFWLLTTGLTSWITLRWPKLDPSPLHDVYGAVTAWYTDRNAARLRSQPELWQDFEQAASLVAIVKDDVHRRAESSPTSTAGAPIITLGRNDPYVLRKLVAGRAMTAADLVDTNGDGPCSERTIGKCLHRLGEKGLVKLLNPAEPRSGWAITDRGRCALQNYEAHQKVKKHA